MKGELDTVWVMDVKTAIDVPLRVVFIPGETKHPWADWRTSPRHMVEFYDRRHASVNPVPGGLFVGGFFTGTILNDWHTDKPLVLDDWLPDLTLDIDTLALVSRWLRSLGCS